MSNNTKKFFFKLPFLLCIIFFSISDIYPNTKSNSNNPLSSLRSSLSSPPINSTDKHVNKAGKYLSASATARIVGLVLTAAGIAISSDRKAGSLGPALCISGLVSYFFVSEICLSEAGSELAMAETQIPPPHTTSSADLSTELAQEKQLNSSLQEIKAQKGVIVQEGIEIEKILVIADADVLGLNDYSNELNSYGKKVLTVTAEFD